MTLDAFAEMFRQMGEVFARAAERMQLPFEDDESLEPYSPQFDAEGRLLMRCPACQLAYTEPPEVADEPTITETPP